MIANNAVMLDNFVNRLMMRPLRVDVFLQDSIIVQYAKAAPHRQAKSSSNLTTVCQTGAEIFEPANVREPNHNCRCNGTALTLRFVVTPRTRCKASASW